MDKDKLTNHIKDIQTKQIIKKVLGICEQSIYSHSVRNTKFLTPDQIELVSQIVSQSNGVSFCSSGMIEEAERRIMYFFPDYMSYEDVEEVLSIVKISFASKDAEIGHRDCLGSLVGLGIDRESIGDIFFVGGDAYVIVLKPLDLFLRSDLTKIKNCKVSVQEVSEIPKHEVKYEEMLINVASLRLDAIVAELSRTSREKAQHLIREGRVRLNYLESKDNSRQLLMDSVISIRGYGKYRVKEIASETKKKRLRVKVLKYSN